MIGSVEALYVKGTGLSRLKNRFNHRLAVFHRRGLHKVEHIAAEHVRSHPSPLETVDELNSVAAIDHDDRTLDAIGKTFPEKFEGRQWRTGIGFKVRHKNIKKPCEIESVKIHGLR